MERVESRSSKCYLEPNVRQGRKFILLEKQDEEGRCPNILRSVQKVRFLSKIAKQMTRKNQDVVGEKCIRNNHGDLAFDDFAKEEWKNYHSGLLNKEFEWDRDGLSSADPILGHVAKIKGEWLKKAINKMKSSKAAGAQVE